MTQALPLYLADELDFDVVDDMREDLGEATGLLVVEQSIYRRLATPRGTLPSPVEPADPNDLDAGTDLLGLLGLGQTPGGVYAIGAMVKSEVAKEAGVDIDTVVVNATVDATSIPATAQIAISGTCLLGPFALTIGVEAFSSGAGTVSLLSTGASS